MKKRSKGMKFTRRGTGVCSLRSADRCTDTDVVIPKRVILKGKVIKIDNYAFCNNTRMKSVTIPEGIVSIGDYAFKNCKNLEHIVLPQSMKSIGKGAFMYCEKLKSIVLPPAITHVATEAFSSCYLLESIDLSHVRSIGLYAFARCDSLKDITIREDVTKIDATSFRDSGYYKCRKNWRSGLLYLGKWVIDCEGPTDEYKITRETVGIATDAFANECHIKRTQNPEFTNTIPTFDTVSLCFIGPPPLCLEIPEYFEEIIPAKIRYEGTYEEWKKIIRYRGKKQIPAIVICEDQTIETNL